MIPHLAKRDEIGLARQGIVLPAKRKIDVRKQVDGLVAVFLCLIGKAV